jgi:hypothetical protein
VPPAWNLESGDWRVEEDAATDLQVRGGVVWCIGRGGLICVVYWEGGADLPVHACVVCVVLWTEEMVGLMSLLVADDRHRPPRAKRS